MKKTDLGQIKFQEYSITLLQPVASQTGVPDSFQAPGFTSDFQGLWASTILIFLR